MSGSGKNIITDWKRVWQLVSGIHHETPENSVLNELLNVSKELQDGLLQFRSTSASDTKLETLLKEKKQGKLLPFTLQLQDLLDLETQQCWEILCYYLTNEYRGSASSLAALILTESNMSKLLDDICGYYMLQRMIVLKIVKNLLMFYKVPNHPYQQQYKQVLDKLTLSRLRGSYLKQLEHLINENPPSKIIAGEFFDHQAKLVSWSARNAREINEVLHILLILCEHLPVGLDEIKRLFTLFKQHSFGKQQRYLDTSIGLYAELVSRVAYSEVILLLRCFDFGSDEEATTLACRVIELLDKDVARMYHNPENGPILFAWMLLNLRYMHTAANDEIYTRYRQFGKRAMDLDCFKYLHALLDNSMFKDDSLVSRIARKTIYNLLAHMCDLFDGDGSCARHPFIYELLCELLTWPMLAKEFCSREEGGVRSLYNTLLETFPLDFVHVSMLGSALAKAGQVAYIKCELEEMPIFTDRYDESVYSLKATADPDDFILVHSVRPFPRIDYVVPAHTSATVMARSEGYFVHFRTKVNYFAVLHHEINCLLAETTQLLVDFDVSDRVRRVNAGLQYLVIALQHTKSLADISPEMVHPTEMCIDLLSKFRTVPGPPIELLANCLDVCTALLPLVDAEIVTRVINLNILPLATSQTLNDYKKYAHGVCFDSRLVGSYLVDVEKKSAKYYFLLAYLNFLRTYTKRNHYFEVEIPGLIFLLREVFPHMHSWHYETPADKNRIYIEIMGFICDILDSVGGAAATAEDGKHQPVATNTQRQLLRNICVYSLLNLENGFVLLRFVALGNAYLQHTMEMESNWMQQQAHGLVVLVRHAMRILMQLLRLKGTIFPATELSPLEALIYTQPKQRDTLRIIPVVTSYMSNIFDRWLPILSCRLLKRIALEFNMSLLACLDMEPAQIRLTFLQKLPDELENDSLKIAILEFVEACIKRQPGVTEAFFKVNYAHEKRLIGKEAADSSQIGDGILTYLEDYLVAVGQKPDTARQALPGKIMDVFHSLWKRNLQLLVAELVRRPTFWQELCQPLLSTDWRSEVRAYTQLLNILSIEMFCASATVRPLREIVLEFVAPAHFEQWLDFVFELPETPAYLPPDYELLADEMPEWLCRLQAFKSFLLILLKRQPPFIQLPAPQFKMLAQKCLRVLVARIGYLDDLRPFILLSEIYLFLVLNCDVTYTESPEEQREMQCLLIKLLGSLAGCFEGLHVRAKEACLGIAIKCADFLADDLLRDSSDALIFLNAVVSIICIELQNVENNIRMETVCATKRPAVAAAVSASDAAQTTSTNTQILSLNLLKTVATIFHSDGPGNWDLPFIANKVFQRLLSCTSNSLQLYAKQPLSVELLDVLIVFAKGNCSGEFLHCDVGDYLWLKLLPPKALLQSTYALGQPSADWTVQKWWPIYARGIELVTVLCRKHSNHVLKEVLQFVGIHEEYLIDSLLLGKQSLEPLAMGLIKCAINLMAQLVVHDTQWRLEHSQSLFSLMRAVQMLLGHSISMFHQPKNVKCLVAGSIRSQTAVLGHSDNSKLVEEVVTAFNGLTEIIILCAQCLLRFSPNLLDLICEPEFLVSKWEPIFEIHFGAPKLTAHAVALTFGTVLSIVGIYTKVLNLQNYDFHGVPLNVLPREERDASAAAAAAEHDKNNSDIASADGGGVQHRTLSKSLSVTSATSVNCPPNELLCNLDAELCILALEHILTLAASQSMLALKSTQLPPREKQLIRREISTELLSYHEFVRKRVLADYREHKEIWYRRKYGQVFMHCAGDGDDAVSNASPPVSRPATDTSRRQSTDLRVNVVRRLHLQHQQQQQQQQHTPAHTHGTASFEMSRVLSPIGGACVSDPVTAVSSTPNSTRAPLRRSNDEASCGPAEVMKRVHMEDAGYDETDEATECVQYFPPTEPKYSPLSYVQLVEEDYLHFMSNLFMVICQSDSN